MSSNTNSLQALFVLPAFYRNGAARFAVQLAEELTCCDVAVEILAMRSQTHSTRFPESPVKSRVILTEDQSLLRKLPVVLSQLVRSALNADIIVFPWENRLLLPGLIAWLLRKPTLAIVQNNIQKSLVDYPVSRSDQWVLRWVYSWANAIVCTSTALMATIDPAVNKKKIMSISNGIDIEQVRSLSTQPCSAIPDQHPFVVGIGRLTSQKGVDLLIRAHAMVLAQGTPHQLVLIGEGDEYLTLIELCAHLGVSDSVTFLGFVPNPYPILAQASLFCLPSRYEGFGLVVAEAAVLGVPTIATDCVAGPREILADGEYGDLVETESVEALADAIAKHFQNPQRLQQKAQASAQQAQRFSMRTCGQKYAELIRQCVGSVDSRLDSGDAQSDTVNSSELIHCRNDPPMGRGFIGANGD